MNYCSKGKTSFTQRPRLRKVTSSVKARFNIIRSLGMLTKVFLQFSSESTTTRTITVTPFNANLYDLYFIGYIHRMKGSRRQV